MALRVIGECYTRISKIKHNGGILKSETATRNQWLQWFDQPDLYLAIWKSNAFIASMRNSYYWYCVRAILIQLNISKICATSIGPEAVIL